MRTALILAFAPTGDVSLVCAPSVPYDEVRERWSGIQNLDEHPEDVIRYELWTDTRGLLKHFVPGKVEATLNEQAQAHASAETVVPLAEKIRAKLLEFANLTSTPMKGTP